MLAIAVILVIAMFVVMYFDATRFIIPNWLVGGLLILYPVALFLTPAAVDWKSDLLGMLGVFALGYVIFAIRAMGGGDVKLIIVLSLWVGLQRLAAFGFNFAVLGGVLSIVILILRGVIPAMVKDQEKLPRIFKKRQPVPYGLAIGGAFMLMIAAGEIPILNSELSIVPKQAQPSPAQ